MRRGAAAAACALLLLAGCSSGSPAPAAQRKLTVLAAASLTGTFTQLGRAYERQHPGTTVTFSFGGSSALAEQIVNGAPADVFAAASAATMKQVTDAGDAAGQPAVFVRNQLVIAVPKGNPAGVRGLVDLGRAGVKVALCARQVPCGAAAVKVLKAARLTVHPVTLEQDVKAALAKVRLGEVDAALVYRTDVRAAAGDVQGIEFPESAGAINDYPIVALAHAPSVAAARDFVAYIRSAAARAAFTAAGFQPP